MLVATASNGEEAIEKFKAYNPEVITMDLTMPHMDGLECIENLVQLDPSVRLICWRLALRVFPCDLLSLFSSIQATGIS